MQTVMHDCEFGHSLILILQTNTSQFEIGQKLRGTTIFADGNESRGKKSSISAKLR